MSAIEISLDKKWYFDLLFHDKNDKIKTNDGLVSLLDMFEDEATFIKHFSLQTPTSEYV